MSYTGRQRVAADLLAWLQTALASPLRAGVGRRVDLDVDDDGDEGGEEEGDGDQSLGKDDVIT